MCRRAGQGQGLCCPREETPDLLCKLADGKGSSPLTSWLTVQGHTMNLGTIAQLPLPSDTASVSLQLSSLEVRGGSEPQGLYSGEQWGGGGPLSFTGLWLLPLPDEGNDNSHLSWTWHICRQVTQSMLSSPTTTSSRLVWSQGH